MARRPPQRSKAADTRGPRETKKLPDRPDAKRTWSGPPYDRSPRRWSGTIDFGGKKHNVGTFDTPREWGITRDALIVELREAPVVSRGERTELEGLTVSQFVARCGWPEKFERAGKRKVQSTSDQLRQQSRPFIARFGDRPIKGGITRHEARQWAQAATRGHVAAAQALMTDAFDTDETVGNPLRGLGHTTRGRRDLPDVLSVEEVERLKALARQINPDDYGQIMEAMIEVMATSAPRPGELWAMERARLRPERGEIYIKHAVKAGGVLGPPKYGQERECVLVPSALELILRLPVLHPRHLFPSRTGRLMTQPNWTTYWHPVREAFTAQLPDDHWLRRRIADCTEARLAEPDPDKRRRMPHGKLDFYEMRHRACTFMATPKPHGLSLAAADIAYQIGHRDGGRLVEELYIHRNPELARARIRTAMGYGTQTSRTASGSSR
jgi:integrase